MEKAQGPSSKGGSSSLVTPPARKVTAPSPKTPASKPEPKPKVRAPRGKKHHHEDEDEEEEYDEEGEYENEVPEETLSEGAKNNRLRRICERKPSGKLQIAQEIHEQWCKGGSERLALRDQLEKCGWDKDGPFLS